MAAAEKPAQRPEGRLLGEALKRDGRSASKVAQEAGISGTRWRHIVNGYQPVGGDQSVVVIGPALTIARMAKVVGVTPDELAAAGRQDAAEELRVLLASEDAFEEFRTEHNRRLELLQIITAASRTLADAAAELARIEQLDDARPLVPFPMAAYRTDTPSIYEQQTRAQDEASEAPDADGSEHGA